MHSSLVRIQNVFGYFTTVAFVVGLLIAGTSFIAPQTPEATLVLRNVQVVKGRPHYYSTKREEYAHIKFDLDADLSDIFSWNTKQVFVYVTAVFPSSDPSVSASSATSEPSEPHSEAIIWDAIIPASNAPWHPNTYIHPGTGSTRDHQKRNPKLASKDIKADTSKKSSSSSTSSRTADPLPYPPGAEEGILRLAGQKPKYQITTPWGRIAGLQDCTLHLRYNIQPWVGALAWSRTTHQGFWMAVKGGSSEGFDMPEIKSVAASKSREELGTATGGEANRGSPA